MIKTFFTFSNEKTASPVSASVMIPTDHNPALFHSIFIAKSPGTNEVMVTTQLSSKNTGSYSPSEFMKIAKLFSEANKVIEKFFRHNAIAKILKTDGSEIEVAPKNGKGFSLAECQKIVGGHIEIVSLSNGRVMIANEEGRLRNLSVNLKASKLWGDIIVGDVLVCEPSLLK